MLLYGQEPVKASYHPVKFGHHNHFGSGDMFSVCHNVILTCGVTSTCLVSLIWVNYSRCTLWRNLMVIGSMEMEIILTRIQWKKLNYSPQTNIIRDLQNQEYRFTIPKSRIWLVKKQEEKKNTGNYKALFVSRKSNKPTLGVANLKWSLWNPCLRKILFWGRI